jgi:hypothetical protein
VTVIPALKKLRQEDHKIKANLGYKVKNLSLKQNKNKTKAKQKSNQFKSQEIGPNLIKYEAVSTIFLKGALPTASLEPSWLFSIQPRCEKEPGPF